MRELSIRELKVVSGAVGPIGAALGGVGGGPFTWGKHRSPDKRAPPVSLQRYLPGPRLAFLPAQQPPHSCKPVQ